MIQELLGGAGLLGSGERKLSINGAVFETSPSPSLSPSPSFTAAAAATKATPNAAAAAAASTSENQNLRCPRCDSSNTKFCYYNNYNLTQPRHFCKTCRRYWTKGGALRNVPIGGGCRKNKSATVVTSIGKSSAGKLKTATSEIGRSGLVINGSGFEHDLWASPQNSHILALLRATQNSNPNPISNNSMAVKAEEMMNIGSHMMSEPVVSTGGALNLRTHLGLDPSLGLCSSFWKNNLHEATQNQHHHQQNGIILGEVENSGMQELYQRLRSSTASNYYSDHSQAVLGNVGSSSSSSSSSSTILESAAVGGGDLSYWNPAFSWFDHLPTTNGAYP